MLIYKLTWRLKDGITMQKADLPDHYKVPLNQKTWSKKKLKAFLEQEHYYKIKKMEKL